MSRVWVVQNQTKLVHGQLLPKFDLRPAEKFGELRYILTPTARVDWPAPTINDIHNKLAAMRQDDYLLLLGNPCLIGWVVAIAAYYTGGLVNLLQWEGRTKEYITVRCDLRVAK